MGNGSSNSDGSGGDQIITHREEENWTNERHLDFLSSMEDTFVKNLLESHRFAAGNHHRRCNRRRSADGHVLHRLENLRLDRYVPDCSESTRDLHSTKNTSRSVQVWDLVSRSGRRHNKERPTTTHPYKISHDQVVPQVEDNSGDKDGKERP